MFFISTNKIYTMNILCKIVTLKTFKNFKILNTNFSFRSFREYYLYIVTGPYSTLPAPYHLYNPFSESSFAKVIEKKIMSRKKKRKKAKAPEQSLLNRVHKEPPCAYANQGVPNHKGQLGA